MIHELIFPELLLRFEDEQEFRILLILKLERR